MSLQQLKLRIDLAKKAEKEKKKKFVSNRVNNKTAKPVRMKYHRS